MRQARTRRRVAFLISVVLSALAARATAQTTAPPEGWVVLPLDEYKALREKALPVAPAPAPPPVDATLTRVDYELRVAGDAVTGRARRGRVSDASGAVIAGVTIELVAGAFRGVATTNVNGDYILTGVPNGKVAMTANLSGFTTQRPDWAFNRSPVRVDFTMTVGQVVETVTVSGATPRVDTQSVAREDSSRLVQPSQKVINLQQRAAGVLPVRIEVPKAGTSHRFVKPLVVDEESVVVFSYKRR
jgi:carboxypeptidase family protein